MINKRNVFPISAKALYDLCIMTKYLPELSFPFSGLPLEYIVANLPSRIKRNQPLEPFESSKAAESDQT